MAERGLTMAYYAVKNGRKVGLFDTWDECRGNVIGYPNSEYKKFITKEEAEEYLGIQKSTVKARATVGFSPLSDRFADSSSVESKMSDNDWLNVGLSLTDTSCVIYVDGSFNTTNSVYGYGVVIYTNTNKYVLSGADKNADIASMRNVAGEVVGVLVALQKAIELGMKDITLYYDYEGLEKWATEQWLARTPITFLYREYCKAVQTSGVHISWCKVRSHSNNTGNEIVDKLAYTVAKKGKCSDLSKVFIDAQNFVDNIRDKARRGIV